MATLCPQHAMVPTFEPGQADSALLYVHTQQRQFQLYTSITCDPSPL
jgi:hypothetical protein